MRIAPAALAFVLGIHSLSAGKPPSLKHIVALDIGHTPAHPGAISATGIAEYEFNTDVVKAIDVSLEGTDTIQPFIITSSKPLTLLDRTRIAAAKNAELFIAIHHDSVQDKYLHIWEVDGKTQQYCDRFSGYSVFFSQKNPQPENSFYFARLLGREMMAEGFTFARHHAEPIKGENREIVDDKAGVYRFNDLIVLKTASMPAVLLECGVIVNRLEEQSLLTSERQEKIAEAVTLAVEKYFASPRPVKPVEIQSTIPRAEPVIKKAEPVRGLGKPEITPGSANSDEAEEPQP